MNPCLRTEAIGRPTQNSRLVAKEENESVDIERDGRATPAASTRPIGIAAADSCPSPFSVTTSGPDFGPLDQFHMATCIKSSEIPMAS